MRMSVKLNNGQEVVGTFGADVDPLEAGREFRKAVLSQARKQEALPIWTSIKAEQHG